MSPYAVVFFISYVLLAAFVVFNLLIGIVIGSMERARESEADRTAGQRVEEAGDATVDTTSDDELITRIRSLQADLAALEGAVRGRATS